MKFEWDDVREPLYFEVNKILDHVRSSKTMTDKQVCDMKTLLSAIEKSYTIEMIEDEYENGYSGYSNTKRTYNRSYSRGNHNYPNYNSGHIDYEKENMRSQLHQMMQTAGDANTKQALQEALNSIR